MNLPEKVFNVCISAKGYYYLNEVMNRFYYFELVLQDTPIFDEVFFNNMCQVFPHCTENGKRNMNNRIETVECFMRYLGEQENHEPRVVLNQLGSIVQDIKNKGMDADIRNIKDKMGLS